MTNSIDGLLAQAADDLTVAVRHFDEDVQRIRSEAADRGRGRRPWLMAAAAVVVCILGVAALLTQRSTPTTVRTDTPVLPTDPATAASTDSVEDASPTTPQAALVPEPTEVNTTVPPSTTGPVVDPFGFVPAPGSVPAGFDLVDVSDTFGQPPPDLPDLFHGIVAAVDAAGVPIDPIIHIELPEGPTGVLGETTLIQVGGVDATYRVWEHQFTGIASPQADIEWTINGTQVAVSGPDDPDLLLSIAEAVGLSTTMVSTSSRPMDSCGGLATWTSLRAGQRCSISGPSSLS